MPTILIAGLFHETHTFLDDETTLHDFRIVRDRDLLDCAGDGSPLGSALAAGSTLGWQWRPTVDYRAQPSGTVNDDIFEQFWAEFSERASAALRDGIDAIYLVLHGAMVTPRFADVEGEFLARVRTLLTGAKELPIFGVFDLHANFTARMAAHAHCLVAYRENPHADANAMAVRAVELLADALKAGAKPRTYWHSVPVVWPPTGTCTGDSPMRELEALARNCEQQHPGVLAVNICAGFAFADTPDTGVSFTVVTTGDEATARRILSQLAELAWQRRERGNASDPPVDEVLARLPPPGSGLTVIAEPSDNIAGGAPGDGTGLLRALIQHRIEHAAVCINDPESVDRLRIANLGDTVQLSIGGRGSRLDPGPLDLEVVLVSRSNGRFRLEDPNSHLASMFGAEFDMGRCAVVRHAGVTILLTSRKTPPFDLGQWRSQGIDPAALSVIVAKAAVAHRGAYAPIAARLWSADTPGPCRSDLKTFDFQQVRRPIYPLDDAP